MIEIIIFLTILTGLLISAYSAGKSKATKDNHKETIDAIEKAIEARDSVKSADDARRLLMEYKRED